MPVIIAMKNQYVGDIGDYGKYGLLRFLSNRGIKIGINWYLTKDDMYAAYIIIRMILTSPDRH